MTKASCTRPTPPSTWVRVIGHWWAAVDSNHVPPRYQHGALPVELAARGSARGLEGFEPRQQFWSLLGRRFWQTAAGERVPGRVRPVRGPKPERPLDPAWRPPASAQVRRSPLPAGVGPGRHLPGVLGGDQDLLSRRTRRGLRATGGSAGLTGGFRGPWPGAAHPGGPAQALTPLYAGVRTSLW
jgi:hypothetical protein